MVTKKIQSIRKILLAVLYLEMASILQRLVFDFLGYMWLLILFGIAAIIFVIFGLFGAHQQKTRLLVTYMTWTGPWIIFNLIVILAYTVTGKISHHVEIIQASIQILFAMIGFGLAFRLRKLINIAKEFFIVGNINPYAAYVQSNQAASTASSRNSKPFIITSSGL